MGPKNRHRLTMATVEAAAASMVSERQIADVLVEVGDDPEEKVNPFGSVAYHAGLDRSFRTNPRELGGNDFISQKDQQFDLLL